MRMIGTNTLALLISAFAATTALAQPPREATKAASVDSPQRPPNFVLVLMDDLGWKDLGVTGSLYHQTPNIDRIARAGAVFNQAYSASPLCSPSRGALLSGKAPARTALTNVIRGFDDPYGGLHEITKPMEWPNGNTQYLEAFARHVLPLEEVTIAEALAEAGYVTGYYGKWHIGQNAAFNPDKQGFQRVNILGERDGGPSGEMVEGDPKWVRTLTSAAVRFIEEQKEKPFFLMVSHWAVHRPHKAHPELIAKYRALPTTDQGDPVYAALLEMAGLSLRPRQHLDGQSLMPLLTGGGALPERALFFHFPHPTHATGPYASIISAHWKLIRWYNDASGAYSLFNLAEDPGELVDLADRLPDRVKDLNDRLVEWQRETKAQMPLPNPRFDPSLPAVRDKAFTVRLAMKERAEFERRLKEYQAKVSKPAPR
jgi:arylsulfatase A-like enzyme